jgi:N-acetyl-gamma-glutamyl-phosphate reductase
MYRAPALLDSGVRVIDLAADFRIKDIAEWERCCGMPHACPNWIENAVYGLPEINREQICSARLIANQGSYPIPVQLGIMSLAKPGLVKTGSLIADAESRVSGAGRKAEAHILFSEASDNFKTYAVSGHRHLPEIRQGLSSMANDSVGLTFVPHLVPMNRGIHATLYARLKSDLDFQSLSEKTYANEFFVDLLPAKSHPEKRSFRSANTCRIAVHRPQGVILW